MGTVTLASFTRSLKSGHTAIKARHLNFKDFDNQLCKDFWLLLVALGTGNQNIFCSHLQICS